MKSQLEFVSVTRETTVGTMIPNKQFRNSSIFSRLITVFRQDGNGGNGGTGRDGKTAVKMVPPTNSLTVVTYRPVPLIKTLPLEIIPSRPAVTSNNYRPVPP